MMLVLHDDAKREYAYGPAANLPDTHAGTFSNALLLEATKNAWIVVSMKTTGSASSPLISTRKKYPINSRSSIFCWIAEPDVGHTIQSLSI